MEKVGVGSLVAEASEAEARDEGEAPEAEESALGVAVGQYETEAVEERE